jgi:hypothetical protein
MNALPQLENLNSGSECFITEISHEEFAFIEKE